MCSYGNTFWVSDPGVQTCPIFQPCAKAKFMCPPVLPSVLTQDSCGNEILCMDWEGIGAAFQHIPYLHNRRTVF